MKHCCQYLLPLFGLAIATVIGCHRSATPLPTGTGLTVSISTNNIHVGDPIFLRIASVHPTNLHLRAPELAKGKEVIVRNRLERAEKLPDGRVREVVDYAITSLVTGNHILATSPGIVWARPDGTTTQAPFPFVAFKVQSTLSSTNADLSQMRDLHGLARWPDRFPMWLIALLASALIIGLAAWLLRRYLAHVRKLEAEAPPIPAHDAALAALQALLSRGLIEQHQIEPFYVELSAIARRYLEARFQLHAPEETTEEFLREVASSGTLSQQHQQLVAAFLDQCDLVKFARHQPDQNDMRTAYSAAEKLVRETIPTTDDGQQTNNT
ncbi:MAG: hypothetical protein NTY53_09700 [Kiritimatiellaeota bacterium]|nr:hypothetical protein [Kiritimatiellota bacterium]